MKRLRCQALADCAANNFGEICQALLETEVTADTSQARFSCSSTSTKSYELKTCAIANK
ncbi:MAG: hypothetical protein F6K41_15165 [Symploca sp. SIO3E6]|nr:hypothetical protein [Caldora sp. SIO3E6]